MTVVSTARAAGAEASIVRTHLIAAIAAAMALLSPALATAQDASETPAVIVAPIQSQTITASSDFLGRVEAIREVDVTARVEGFLQEVNFTEGSFVEAGQILFEIEKAPYEAELAGARAARAAADAAVAGAQAALTQAQQEVDRQTTLVERGTSPQAVLDSATARRDEAQAHLESARAQVAQADAQLQTADLHLSYTHIVSPFDGRIGRANVTAGNVVGPQSGVLAAIIQSDPIRVVFSISEREYVNLVEAHMSESDEQMQAAFVPTLRLANGRDYKYPGRIAFIDNRIDPTTGTVAVRAEFDNPDSLLLPGQFVTVTVSEGEPHMVAVAPAAAILQDREGPYVLVLDDENRIQIRRIQTGGQTATGVTVTSGLAQGETIVVEGLQRVHPGQIVSPRTAGGES